MNTVPEIYKNKFAFFANKLTLDYSNFSLYKL